MTTTLPEEETDSIPFQNVDDHGDDVDTVPDPHDYPNAEG